MSFSGRRTRESQSRSPGPSKLVPPTSASKLGRSSRSPDVPTSGSRSETKADAPNDVKAISTSSRDGGSVRSASATSAGKSSPKTAVPYIQIQTVADVHSGQPLSRSDPCQNVRQIVDRQHQKQPPGLTPLSLPPTGRSSDGRDLYFGLPSSPASLREYVGGVADGVGRGGRGRGYGDGGRVTPNCYKQAAAAAAAVGDASRQNATTTRSDDELEKMRILARHIEVSERLDVFCDMETLDCL